MYDGRFVIGDLSLTNCGLCLLNVLPICFTQQHDITQQSNWKYVSGQRKDPPSSSPSQQVLSCPLMTSDVLSSLPDDALELICSYVPFKHRFTSCCLVKKRLHAAATAATGDMSLSFTADPEHPRLITPPHRDSALRWLSHQGSFLTRLRINGWCEGITQGPVLRQLPCPHLQELKLKRCSVQLGAAQGEAGVIAGCTQLTHLELSCNIVDDPATTVGAAIDRELSRLVHLQHLRLHPSGYRNWACLSAATLPCLQHLTYLSVQYLSVANLLQLGTLTGLQGLDLLVKHPTIVGPSAIPGLVFPAALKTLLLLQSTPFEAGLVHVLPSTLQELQLTCAVEGGADSLSCLLSCMTRLQHLTRLSLQPSAVRRMQDGPFWPQPGPIYSALTASSRLVHLGLPFTKAGGIWPHVFASAQQLSHLISLHLQDGFFPSDLTSRWGAADVASLVSSCPSLRYVGSLSMQHGVHVSELRKLTALTRLDVRYCSKLTHDEVEKSTTGLACVTQLRSLDVKLYIRWMTMDVLLPLTHLTALTYLGHDFYEDNRWSCLKRKKVCLLLWVAGICLHAQSHPAMPPTGCLPCLTVGWHASTANQGQESTAQHCMAWHCQQCSRALHCLFQRLQRLGDGGFGCTATPTRLGVLWSHWRTMQGSSVQFHLAWSTTPDPRPLGTFLHDDSALC